MSRPRTPLLRVLAVLAVAIAALAAFAAAFPPAARADDAPPAAPAETYATYAKIRVIDFEGEIEAAIAAYVSRRLEEAQRDGVDCVVFRIESPGGLVSASKDVADEILDLPKSIRTIAWIPEYAYSGAAMVTLACDEIVMAPRAVLGDCQPILMGPEGIIPVGEKVETVLRADFRRFAEDNGWPALLAEKMVSKDFEVVQVRDPDGGIHYVRGDELRNARDDDFVDGVRKSDLVQVRVAVAKDQLLTLTTSEAVEFGFARRTFAKESAFLEALKAPGAQVTFVEMTASESAGRWLLGWAGVLSAIVALCVAISLFQGIGTFTYVGIGAFAMLLLVTGTADLPNGFGLLLFAVGAILLAFEVFVLPGFGIAGIAGLFSLVLGLLFISTGVSFSGGQMLTWEALGDFALEFIATVGVALAAFLVLTRFFPSAPFFRRALLLQGAGLDAGAVVVAAPSTRGPLVGRTGTALTTLRPAGRASLEGQNFDVVSEGGYVEAGTPVLVVAVEGSRVIVRPSPPAGGPPA